MIWKFVIRFCIPIYMKPKAFHQMRLAIEHNSMSRSSLGKIGQNCDRLLTHHISRYFEVEIMVDVSVLSSNKGFRKIWKAFCRKVQLHLWVNHATGTSAEPFKVNREQDKVQKEVGNMCWLLLIHASLKFKINDSTPIHRTRHPIKDQGRVLEFCNKPNHPTHSSGWNSFLWFLQCGKKTL